MACLRSNNTRRRKKPWRARVTIDGVRYLIGYFPSREEAEAAEFAFRGGPPDRRVGALRAAATRQMVGLP